MQHPGASSELPQLDAMRAGVEYHWKIKCRNQEFMVRPLTALEIIKVAEEVADELEAMAEKHRIGVTASLKSAVKTLELASTPSPDEFAPKLTGSMMSRMTSAEISYLHDQYVAGTQRVNPALDILPVDTVKALVEQVKKSPEMDSTAIVKYFLDLANSFLLLSGESPN